MLKEKVLRSRQGSNNHASSRLTRGGEEVTVKVEAGVVSIQVSPLWSLEEGRCGEKACRCVIVKQVSSEVH